MVTRYEVQTLIDEKSTYGINLSVSSTYNKKYNYESLIFRIKYCNKKGVDYCVINNSQLDCDRLTLILDSVINRLIKEVENDL